MSEEITIFAMFCYTNSVIAQLCIPVDGVRWGCFFYTLAIHAASIFVGFVRFFIQY